MKRVVAILSSAMLWASLGAFCGHYVGSKGGYVRGVRDVTDLVTSLRDAGDELPSPFTSGAI